MSTATSPTAALVDAIRNVRYEDLPADVIERAKHCILDWYGCALAGSNEELTRILRALAVEEGGEPQATLVGGGSATAAQATLVNGSAGHALDYDDVQRAMSGHPTVPVLPAALAMAEWIDCSPHDVITAFVVGVEVECRLGTATMPSHYARGFHATGTLGTMGAAAACAHLLGLDREQWLNAVGIAAAQAAGLKSMFGTMTKPLHAGKAAANGLLAARLAARGFTAATDSLEVAQGFGATQSDGLRAEGIGRPIGETWALRQVLFKYHAACFGTHPAIETVLHLRETHGVEAGDVDAIELRVPKASLAMCNIPDPTTPLEAKFSLRQTAAMAMLGMPTDESGFNALAVADERASALRQRITVTGDAGPGDGALTTGTVVTIALRDGSEFSGSIDVDTPEPNLDRQWFKLAAKCRGLATPVIGPGAADELVERVRTLESAVSIRELARLTEPMLALR